jgi:hypothetical protein
VTSFPFTLPDVHALSDVVTDITEASDSLPVEDCIAYRLALVGHLDKVRRAIDALDQQLVLTMELPIVEGGFIHQVRRRKEKVRYDHSVIARHVRDAAILDEKGLLVTPREAAENATRFMRDIYISDSTKAKVGALKVLDIPRREVESFELADLYLDVQPILSEVQE